MTNSIRYGLAMNWVAPSEAAIAWRCADVIMTGSVGSVSLTTASKPSPWTEPGIFTSLMIISGTNEPRIAKRFIGIASFYDVVTFIAKLIAQHHSDEYFVFDDQDAIASSSEWRIWLRS
jgi:hypothetical protein